MIINSERKPDMSLYYVGGKIIEILFENKSEQLDFLLETLKTSVQEDMHFDFFYYALDWLFILSAIKLEEGRVSLCL